MNIPNLLITVVRQELWVVQFAGLSSSQPVERCYHLQHAALAKAPVVGEEHTTTANKPCGLQPAKLI